MATTWAQSPQLRAGRRSAPSAVEPQQRPRQSRVVAYVGACCLAGYMLFIAAHFSSGFGGADSSGYVNSAYLLTQGKLKTTVPVAAGLQTVLDLHCPLGFSLWRDSDQMAPTYTVGLPILLAASSTIAGWHWGPLLLYVCGTALTLVLCYAVSRELGAAPIWAALATGMLAVSPLTIWSAEQIMSDGPAATCCAVAFYAALRGRRSQVAAALCGVALGFAVYVRLTNLLLLPALAVLLGERRKLVAACWGGAPLAIGLACYNTYLWKEPWRTGYGRHRDYFEWVSLGPTLVYYVKWIPRLLPIGAFGLMLAPFLAWRTQRRELLAVSLWAGAIIGAYAFYCFTRLDWWWSRFILPAYPALAILGALGLARLAEIRTRRGLPWLAGLAATALVAVSIALSHHDWKALGVSAGYRQPETYAQAADWLLRNTPPQSTYATLHMSGVMTRYERAILRFDRIAPDQWRQVQQMVRASGQPLYLVDWPHCLEEALNRRVPGPWKKIAQIDDMAIWRYSLE